MHLWLGPMNHCECSQTGKLTVYQLENYINKDKLESIRQRREKEFKHYQTKHPFEKKDILIAQPNIPLSYPIQGAEVMPLHTIVLPGKKLTASFGNLNTLADVSEEVVQGRGTKLLIIITSYVKLLNHIQKHVTYTSTTYLLDVVDMSKFPVTIRQLHLPKLFDSGPDNSIRNMVTITIKAFLCYHKLQILLKSIKQYYPYITVIVADDSEHPEKIEEANVQHYIMPFERFAGSNLAISQVTTKYYLWVDDDFIFTEKTKIEKFVDVFEKSNLDVVGGSVDGNEYKFKMFYQEGEDSSCLHLRSGFYHPLEGFLNCVVTSGVTTFFLAQTEESRCVGFDPKLQRVAHLDNLQVGSCNEVIIGHQSHQISTNVQEANVEKLYDRFRNSFQKELRFKLPLHYFKNRMKCYSKG
uniref:Beta-1,4-N-acetyl-galactosaminyltransferase 2 (SID blood group) n=1 Tax=Naja naja TaxID=35670 RepID=A0A8C6XHU9_NAJNA